jgi:hypothetical protein
MMRTKRVDMGTSMCIEQMVIALLPNIQAQRVHTDVLIIGAGIAGATLAHKLQSTNLSCIVLDKGRGVGGRMSTRRRGDVVFDHGAQFITVRDPRAQDIFDDLLSRGVVREWFRGSADGLPRYCGTQGMSRIVHAIAEGCDVRTSFEVASLSHDGMHWTATCVNGDTYTARVVVSSAPVPQTLNLLANGAVDLGNEIHHELSSLRYERCIAALVTTSAPVDVRSITHPDLAYIGDNLDKGISATPSYTIHATPDFSERMWDEDRHTTAQHLARCVFGDALPGVIDVDVHGWKFSRPIDQAATTVFEAVMRPQLLLIGDAFGGARVEGAMISALDAAERITLA